MSPRAHDGTRGTREDRQHSEAGERGHVLRGSDARIIDAVLGAQRGTSARTLLMAFAALSLSAHALMAGLATRARPSLESWSAEIAAEIHLELTRYERVDLSAPRALPPPAPTNEDPPQEAPVASAEEPAAPQPPAPPRALAPPKTARGPRRASATPDAKAQPSAPPTAAAQVITAPDDAPLDLTGESIVSGSASAYAGGATHRFGTGTTPTAQASAAPESPQPRDGAAQGTTLARATPVQLSADGWRCSWPEQARDQGENEQHVVLRVLVERDGRAREVTLISDPGAGFGQAARRCALATRFTPALDAHGKPMRALSPPIRVRFTR